MSKISKILNQNHPKTYSKLKIGYF
jgi:hypothetical protein